MALDQYIKDMAKRMGTSPSSTAISTPSASSGQSSSLSNYISNMAKRMEYKSIGFDTLGADLDSVANGAVSYLEGGWPDQSTNAAQKQSLTDLITRLNSAKQYYSANASQFSGDVNKSIGEIDKALASLTELSGYVDEVGKAYGNYGSKEEYDSAVNAAEFMSWAKDKTTAELEGMISDIKLAQWGYEQSGKPYKIHAVSDDTYNTYLPYLESQLASKRVDDYVAWAKQQGDFATEAVYKKPDVDYDNANEYERIYMTIANPALYYAGFDKKAGYGPMPNIFAIFEAVDKTGEAGKVLEMSKDEKETFFYLYNTGKQKEAIEFASALDKVAGERLKGDVTEFSADLASNHPWLSTVAAIGTGVVFSMPTAVDNLVDAVTGKGYDETSGFNLLGTASDTVLSTVPEAWAKKYGWDDSTKGTASFLYSTGVSIVQNVATSFLFGGYSGLGASAGKIAAKAGEWASLVAMGAQAANSTMREMAAKGATDAQIYALGLVSGVAETMLEKVPLDELLKIGKTGGKSAVKNILNQAWGEFKEEAVTEAINIIAEAVVMQGDSDLVQTIKKDGLKKAFEDALGNILMAGASGALSGGLMGGAFTLYGYNTDDAKSLRQTGKFIMDNGAADILIKQGLKLGQGSEAYELAALLQKRSENNGGQLKSTSAADVGRLYALETQMVLEQYMQSATDKISAQLEAAGIKSDSKVKKLAGAVARIIAGEGTKADARAVTRSKEATAIVTASATSLDPSVAWNPIAKSTVYKLSDKSLMVISRQGTSNVYNVSFAYDGETETAMNMEGRTVRQVEGMIERAREGADIDGIVSGLKGQVSTGEAVENTLESAMAYGVSDNIVNLALALTEATGGDLRIMFDPKLAGTGNRGVHKNYYDGTRLARIAPNIDGIISTIAHEIFHDLENTAAGKAFIKAAVEYAKNSPAKDSGNGSNRYEEVVKLYKKQNPTTSQEDLLTEVAAKVAGELLMDEKALTAVLESMKPSDVESLGTKLKRAANALKRKLKGIKNAKPVETQVDVLLKLYNKAFAQRVIQDAVENPVVGDPAAEAKKLAAETAKKVKSDNKKEPTSMNEENMQVSEEKEKAPEREKADIVMLDNGKQYVEATESQVISGNDPDMWAQQLATYINNIIRGNQDFTIKTTQGDYLTITRDTAYKAGTRNQIRNPDGTYRLMTDSELRVKLNAEVHINELAEVSRKWNRPNATDGKKHKFAKDGFSYRTAYFKDFDGQYYKLTISVGENGSVSTVYNVGRINKDTLPNGKIKTIYSGSKANSVSNNAIISQKSDLSTGKSDISEKNAPKADIEEISATDKQNLKSIGQKKHVNDFDSNDIKITEKWARIYWDDENLKEKSPFFRAWFGEWRAHSTKRVNVVTQKSDTRGLKKNEDTGWLINRSSKVSGERHNSPASTSGYSYLPYIDGIIENAVLLDSAISDKTDPNSLFYHYMYAVVDDGNGKHVIKLTVEEILNPGKETERRAYKLIDIEKYQPSGRGSPKLTSLQTADTIKSIADLVAFVKGYDKYFSPAPEVNKLMLERGRPKVYYHGTKSKFYVFDKSKLDDTLGFFFTENADEARDYGEPQAYYLNVRNPIDLWSDEYSLKYATIKNNEDRVKALQADGYDGIESRSHGIQWIIAFENTQIKSATDNIGTFDKNNPDIRYDIEEDHVPNSSREYAQMKKQKEAPEIDPEAEMKAIKNQAEIHQDRVYSSAEIERALKAIEAVKNTNAAVARIARKLAVAFNTTEDADKIRTAAVSAADEMVSHAVAEGKIVDGEEALTAEYIINLRDKIADDIVEAHKSGGHDSLKLRLETAQAAARVIIDATKAREMARHKRETGQLACDEWKDLTKAVGKIVSRYSVSVKNTRDFAKKYKAFIETQANSLHKAILDYTGDEDLFKAYTEEKRSGKNQVLEIIDMSVARQVYEMAELGEDIPLSSEELKTLHAALRNLLALDNRYNRVHMDGRWQNTDKYAKQGIADSESEYGSDGKKQIGVGWIKQVEDPYDVASSVGGHNRDSVLARAVRVIQHAATEAQYKEMQYMKEVEDFFGSHKAFRKKYKEQRIEFKTLRKNPVTGQQVEGSVTMTLGAFLGLYMTSKRKQAFISLAMSDIVFDKMPGVRDHEQRLAGLKMQYEGLTEAQIEAAMRGMGNALIAEIEAQYEKIADDDIRAFVAAVERFFNEVSTGEKTETDLLLYGYTNVLGSYYYPLERDKNAFDVNLIGNDRIIGNMVGVSNFSFNKATVERASKPLMIRDTMTVMRRHAHQLATYTTMTVPLQNINRIYNCHVTYKGNDTTMKDFIQKNVWSGFGKYLRNYLLDVQGSRRADADFEELRSLLSTVKSNYAKSVLAINPKSILTQFSTVIAMQGQVSYASWAKGLAMAAFIQRTEGEDGKILSMLAEMDKYSHGAAVRNDSNEIYLATGAVGKLGNVTDKLMIGQLVTDRLTCFAMYAMCQYEVQRTQGLAVGTAENKAAAGKMLDEMILNLQDTSAAATKTALARSTNEFISNFAMFKSSELKQFSRIAYALADMRAHGVTRARVGAFGKELGALLGSKVYAAVIALAWAAYRGRWEEDDEGKDRGFIEMLTSELLMDMVGFVPVFGSLAENVMTGFGLELPSESVVNDLITAIRSTGGIISDIADGGGFEFKKVVNILSSAGQTFGLPVRNLANVVEGAFNMAGIADSRIKYRYDKFMSGGSATVNDLREAIDAGDERLAESVADMLMYDRVGSSAGSEAASEIVDLYNSVENNSGLLPSKIADKYSITVNGESTEVELTSDQKKAMTTEYGKSTAAVKKLVNSSAYSRLTTEERASAVRATYKLYMERAKVNVLGADMSSTVAASSLMDPTKLICASAHIRAIKSDSTVKNKAAQIKRWLRSQGLTPNEQKLILYMNGYRTEENRRAVERLLRSSKLTKAEKEAIKKALSLED